MPISAPIAHNPSAATAAAANALLQNLPLSALLQHCHEQQVLLQQQQTNENGQKVRQNLSNPSSNGEHSQDEREEGEEESGKSTERHEGTMACEGRKIGKDAKCLKKSANIKLNSPLPISYLGTVLPCIGDG